MRAVLKGKFFACPPMLATAFIFMFSSFVFLTSAVAQENCVGVGATASTATSTACGPNATATGPGTTAVGAGAIAGSSLGGDGATAVGANSVAAPALGGGFANNATALGNSSFATGDRSIAIGFQPLAVTPFSGAYATNSIAIGTNALAGTTDGVSPPGGVVPGTNAIALGNRAQAFQDNSVAIGPGAVATLPNQMTFGVGLGNALGIAPTSYYMPGLTSNVPASTGDQLVSVNPTTGQLTKAPATATATGLSMGTLSTTGLASLNSLDVTNNTTIGGTLAVTGVANLNGGVQTTTLNATGSVTTPLVIATTGNITTINSNTGNFTNLNATTANVTNLNAGTANVQTANVQTANVQTINVATAFNAAPGSTLNMGGNRVENVGTPIDPTDAANKAYVDSGLSRVTQGLNQAFKKIDENTQGVAIALAMGGISVPDSKDGLNERRLRHFRWSQRLRHANGFPSQLQHDCHRRRGCRPRER